MPNSGPEGIDKFYAAWRHRLWFNATVLFILGPFALVPFPTMLADVMEFPEMAALFLALAASEIAMTTAFIAVGVWQIGRARVCRPPALGETVHRLPFYRWGRPSGCYFPKEDLLLLRTGGSGLADGEVESLAALAGRPFGIFEKRLLKRRQAGGYLFLTRRKAVYLPREGCPPYQELISKVQAHQLHT